MKTISENILKWKFPGRHMLLSLLYLAGSFWDLSGMITYINMVYVFIDMVKTILSVWVSFKVWEYL